MRQLHGKRGAGEAKRLFSPSNSGRSCPSSQGISWREWGLRHLSSWQHDLVIKTRRQLWAGRWWLRISIIHFFGKDQTKVTLIGHSSSIRSSLSSSIVFKRRSSKWKSFKLSCAGLILSPEGPLAPESSMSLWKDIMCSSLSHLPLCDCDSSPPFPLWISDRLLGGCSSCGIFPSRVQTWIYHCEAVPYQTSKRARRDSRPLFSQKFWQVFSSWFSSVQFWLTARVSISADPIIAAIKSHLSPTQLLVVCIQSWMHPTGSHLLWSIPHYSSIRVSSSQTLLWRPKPRGSASASFITKKFKADLWISFSWISFKNGM